MFIFIIKLEKKMMCTYILVEIGNWIFENKKMIFTKLIRTIFSTKPKSTIADSSPEEPASVTTSIDEEVPTVQRRTKALGGVDKWKFAPTVPKVGRASRKRTIAEGQSDKA
jgi:hypothetical protein